MISALLFGPLIAPNLVFQQIVFAVVLAVVLAVTILAKGVRAFGGAGGLIYAASPIDGTAARALPNSLGFNSFQSSKERIVEDAQNPIGVGLHGD